MGLVWSGERKRRLNFLSARFFLNFHREAAPVTVTSDSAVTTIPGENYDQIKFGMDVESNQHFLGYVP